MSSILRLGTYPSNYPPASSTAETLSEEPLRFGIGILRFPIGRLVATSNALAQITPADIATGLKRHVQGDWGDLDPDDKAANDTALVDGSRLLSAYHAADGTKFWIITEADRSATTVLLPEDY